MINIIPACSGAALNLHRHPCKTGLYENNYIQIFTYLTIASGRPSRYNKYDEEKGAFVATEGTAKEGDTIKLTADLIAETDKANPKGNKRTGDISGLC